MDTILTNLTTAMQSVATMFVNFFNALGNIFVDNSGESPELTIIGIIVIVTAAVSLGSLIIWRVIRMFRIRG